MNKKIIFSISILLSLIYICGCALSSREYTKQFIAMDTYMSLKAYGDFADNSLELAKTEINRLDLLLSAEKENSEISILNSTGYCKVSSDTATIIETALSLGNNTEGTINIAIYPIVELWGFPGRDYYVPKEAELEQLLPSTSLENIIFNKSTSEITLKDNAKLDLGAIAKGYTSDKVIEILKNNGVTSAIISLGQNVQTLGRKPDGSLWTVGIKNPDTDNKKLSTDDIIGTLSVENKAVISSGNYERFFISDGQKYHHIIDPDTGYPADTGLISVTIVSESGIVADALSTALFVMGKDKALDYWDSHRNDFDVVFIEENGNITITSGLQNTFNSKLPYSVAR